MNLNRSRIGVLLAPAVTLWTGTVVTYAAAEFVLTVATNSGSLSALSADLAVFLSDGRCARIRSVTPSLNVIVLAENPIEFAAPMTLSVYNVRLPFPRYQRVTEAGTVYKDFDIPFPGQYLAMPPTACCVPEVIVAAVGKSVSLSALASVGMGVGATIVAYAWSPGAGGVITGSGATVSVTYSTPGFRYLSLMITDSNGALSFRYVPCWIGVLPTPLTAARLTWRVGGGWAADLEFVVAPSYLQRSPVAVVDLDTNAVLFFGFIHPQTLRYDFERRALSLTALSALAYMAHLYSYPFLLTSVGVGQANEWAKVHTCTLQRATWFLLYWHSTIPRLVNITFEAAPRAIQGQEFQAGALLSQLQTVCKAAFWHPRGYRSGGMRIMIDPLYDKVFSGGATLTLSSAEIDGEIEYSRAMEWISEARLSGVYWANSWKPLIIRAPAHPEDIGRPEEVTNLAPREAVELRNWAARHLGLAQALQYNFKSLADVDLASVTRIVLPSGADLSPETLTYQHDAATLRWELTVGGRGYGVDVSTVVEPSPPPVVVPPPGYPPLEPPIPPLPPISWGDGSIAVLAVNRYNDNHKGHIFRTFNFRVSSPTWENITPVNWDFVTGYGLTAPIRVLAVTINQITKSVWVEVRGNNNWHAVIRSKDALNPNVSAPTWEFVPIQPGLEYPVTYTRTESGNERAHPMILFDDSLTVGPYVAIRMVLGNAMGGVVNTDRVYAVLYDDNFNRISVTSLGDSTNATQSGWFAFNESRNGFLSYHSYSARAYGLDVPFGAPYAAILNYTSPTRVNSVFYRPLVWTKPGNFLTGINGPTEAWYVAKNDIWNNVATYSVVKAFNGVVVGYGTGGEGLLGYSERPYALAPWKKPGYVAQYSNLVAYQGLCSSVNGGETFTLHTATAYLAGNSHVHPCPVLYPGKQPYYAFFQTFRSASPVYAGKVWQWDIELASLAERTGNLATIIPGAQWSHYPNAYKLLDVWWGKG